MYREQSINLQLSLFVGFKSKCQYIHEQYIYNNNKNRKVYMRQVEIIKQINNYTNNNKFKKKKL